MTTKSRDKGSVKTTDAKSNNLSLIKGIGPARRQWLRETFGIETVTDLAVSSAEEIYTRLKEEQIVSLSKVESWIVQAKEIIDSGMHSSTLKVHENGWKPFASFVVEFQESVTSGEQQTKAHHVEADKTMKWVGIEYTALCDWFIEQLKDKVGLAVSVQSTSSPLQNTESGYNERLRFHLAKVTGQPQTPVAQQ